LKIQYPTHKGVADYWNGHESGFKKKKEKKAWPMKMSPNQGPLPEVKLIGT
jgi:hypothetical protein